ncbi:GGDEF domain-containing protein [Chelativorans sp. Marseille-P2723]|uniref:GGDEF domain-containing protein n=1 Tax=Chelativorans sp. Marseille-P2723 TaxID=2709133 RepID=UPI00156EC56A|nr:GGDEF domain-containing protein [Chelativorans sp. Marseille-P2723]
MSDRPFTSSDLVECFFIPIAVGMPILVFLFRQSEELKNAHAELASLNEQTRKAYQRLRLSHEIMVYTAAHDSMTGLLNRESFLEHLRDAIANREQDVLLLADADNFKQINDRLGHLRGDDALVEISRAIRMTVRHEDVVGRLGGEEFGVLLKGISLTRAMEIAEKIRRQVEAIPWRRSTPDMECLTVSIGVAAIGKDIGTAAAALERADHCLYAAKKQGRNRVTCHDPRFHCEEITVRPRQWRRRVA